MIIEKDEYGNILEREEIKKGFEYKLYLKELGYYRKIGKLINGKLVLNRNENHIHNKSNSYGFNIKLLNSLDKETIVIIKDKTKAFPLYCTINDILTKGFYLHFLSKGFEKQIFLSIDNLIYYTCKI